ncbi:hypothetical protein GZH53_04965 [Flavihumibacter sp. R14]|nr:hypothetical protein [Flavihumibacter soli]
MIAPASAGSKSFRLSFEFYTGTFNAEIDSTMIVDYKGPLSEESIREFHNALSRATSEPVMKALLDYKEKHELNDWLYYQLIRKTAQQLSPKAENYSRYTLYKWFLLSKSGYDARLAISKDQIIFYVRNSEDISDIPFFMIGNKKYMCLNVHDYGKSFNNTTAYKPVDIIIPEAQNSFSYKVTRMPDFNPDDYIEKELEFNYKQKSYHFKVKLNPEVEKIFANYPGVDFESYFNIPLSHETYQSLIPLLRENVKGMNQRKGVDYLMRFTRNAFLYEKDDENFGKEKRLSPEQTLFYDQSDCDDRAALFFSLVKEIYNLPMITLLYPSHITMAVRFDKPLGDKILYEGKRYSVCEPTPQKENLRIGQLSANLKGQPYKVVYSYEPENK